MRSKEILDGDYIIYENGDLYSKKSKKILQGGFTSRFKKYKSYCLCLNGKNKSFYAHRLVAEAFIPNPKNYPQVNHIDGDPSNNNVNNLEWCSSKQNIEHAYRNGLFQSKKCKICGKSRYSHHEICGECKQKIIDELEKENNKNKRLKNLTNQYNIDISCLGERQKEIALSRRQGLTFKQIADKSGVSRQRIQQLIKKYYIN